MRESKINQFILFIGEAGYALCAHSTDGSIDIQSASNDGPQKLDILFDEILSEPLVPLTLIVDTQDQKIISLKLPPLSWHDRRKFLSRKLDELFAEHSYRTLCHASPYEASFAAIETSGTIDRFLPRCDGLYLASLETPFIATKLSQTRLEGWTLFLNWHETSGIRLAALQNRQVIITRLLDAPSSSTSTGYAAATIAVDLRSTRDYLTRLGLDRHEPLHLIAIMPPALSDVMKVTPLDVTSREIFTPHEAAVRLKLSFAPAKESAQGEVLFLLWAAQKRLKSSPLSTPDLRAKARSVRFTKHLTTVAGSFIAVWALYLLFYGLTCWNTNQNILTLRDQVRAQEQRRIEAHASLNQETEPLDRLRRAVQRQRLFMQNEINIEATLDKVKTVLPRDTRFTQFQWKDNKLNVFFLAGSQALTDHEIMAPLAEIFPDTAILMTHSPAQSSSESQEKVLTVDFSHSHGGPP